MPKHNFHNATWKAQSRMKGYSMPRSVRFRPLVKETTLRDDAETINLNAVKPKAQGCTIGKSKSNRLMGHDNGVPGVGVYSADPTVVNPKYKTASSVGISDLPRILDNSRQFPPRPRKEEDREPPGPITYAEAHKGTQIGVGLTTGSFRRIRLLTHLEKQKRDLTQGATPTPGPGAYDVLGERSYTSLSDGASFSKQPRTVKEVASYASLKNGAKTPAPWEYSPYTIDNTMSMQAASALGARCPGYEHPEVDNPDYLFLTQMRDPWRLTQKIK